MTDKELMVLAEKIKNMVLSERKSSYYQKSRKYTKDLRDEFCRWFFLLYKHDAFLRLGISIRSSKAYSKRKFSKFPYLQSSSKFVGLRSDITRTWIYREKVKKEMKDMDF